MDFLLYLALVPALGVVAQWLAWRVGLPNILVLLIFGVALGQIVHPDTFLQVLTNGDSLAGPNLLFPLVSLSVAVVMFEGGLSLKLDELREAGTSALRLVTLGAVITLIGVTVAARLTLGFEWRLCLLLGAILIVTGPTVVGPLLRQVRPHRRVARTLKWEGIVIDPIGAVLAVLVFENFLFYSTQTALPAAAWMLTKTALVGVSLGTAGGALMSLAFRRFWIPDALHAVGALSVAVLLFAISDQLAHESGLITVTVLGIWLSNQKQFNIEHVVELKENLRTLLIGCLFIVLGSRVNINDVAAIGWPGLALVALLIFVVRPLAVYLSLLGSPLSLREQTFVAGMAPRGIVAAAISSVFALRLEQTSDLLQIAGADQLATVTFLAIVGTVAVYGIAASPLAKLLKLADQSQRGVLIVGADPWVCEFARQLQTAGFPVLLVDTNYRKVSHARVGGLNAVRGNFLDEHLRNNLPLEGIGRLMAMTPNHETNALILREGRGLFDRAQLYTLPSASEQQLNGRGGIRMVGRELFASGTTFEKIESMHQAGAVFKTTTLSKSFTYDEFLAKNGSGSALMCVVRNDRTMFVNTRDDPLSPLAGDTIIALVTAEPVPEDRAAKAAARHGGGSPRLG